MEVLIRRPNVFLNCLNRTPRHTISEKRRLIGKWNGIWPSVSPDVHCGSLVVCDMWRGPILTDVELAAERQSHIIETHAGLAWIECKVILNRVIDTVSGVGRHPVVILIATVVGSTATCVKKFGLLFNVVDVVIPCCVIGCIANSCAGGYPFRLPNECEFLPYKNLSQTIGLNSEGSLVRGLAYSSQCLGNIALWTIRVVEVAISVGVGLCTDGQCAKRHGLMSGYIFAVDRT